MRTGFGLFEEFSARPPTTTVVASSPFSPIRDPGPRERDVAAEGEPKVSEVSIHKAREIEFVHRFAPGTADAPRSVAYLRL